MKQISCSVVPSKCLGDFRIGQELGDILNSVAGTNVKFMYRQKNPLETDIVLDLETQGISLRFNPCSQTLRSIEVYDFSRLTLSYSGHEFSSSKILPTFVLLLKTFGPSTPGEYQEYNKSLRYVLNYPGISFIFPIPYKFSNLKSNPDLPITLPDKTTPTLGRMYIYEGDSWSKASTNTLSVPEVLIIPQNGISLKNGDVGISFGMNVQEIISLLSQPDEIMIKKDDAMKIHGNGNSKVEVAHSCGEMGWNGTIYQDYFYNYFQIGFDLLFDGQTHRVKKIVVHTNFPGHVSFNRYRRCFFKFKDTELDFKSKLDEITKALGPLDKPVIYNRDSSSTTKSMNPFGSTMFYGGYEGCVFEVFTYFFYLLRYLLH